MAPDMATLLRSHWYENVASSMPSVSVMADVTAVSVLPVVAVPLMVGCPVAALLITVCSGPGMVMVAWFTSGELRAVHTAESRVQSVVGGRRTVTSLSSVGSMVSVQRIFGLSPWGWCGGRR